MTTNPSNATTPHRGFVAAAKVVASVTLLSRILGLARDALCSRVFGAGPVWSAFAFAFLIPNLARRLFGEGALTGAFIPEYARLLDEDPPAAARYASAMLALTITFLAALTLAGEAVLLALLTLTPLGDSGHLALSLAMLLLPFAPMICATALIGGLLQTHGRFAPTAAAPVILNIAIIAGVLAWQALSGASLQTAAYAAAASVLVAGALQILYSLAAARHLAQWTRAINGAREPVLRTLKKTLPVILGLGALQINSLLDGLIASWPVLVGPTITLPLVGALDYPLDDASNATLFFATRLYQFPLGVFGIALATAVFPLLSRQANDPRAFTTTLREGLRLSLFIGLPASAGLYLVSPDLTAVVYAGGAFDPASVARVSTVLAAYALAVWAYTTNHTLTRAFYAVGDTSTPMRIAVLMVAVNLALNLALIWPLAEVGLALSTALCSVAQLILLARAGKRRFPAPTGALGLTATLALTAAMAAAVLAAQLALDAAPLSPDLWTHRLARLAITFTLGAAVYLGLAIAFKRPEARLLLQRNSSKLG